MNKIYKLKFSRLHQQLIVVSELAGSGGKSKTGGQTTASPFAVLQRLCSRLTLLSVSLLLSGISSAAELPQGGQIMAGEGQISRSGGQMLIQQNTEHMAVSWQSFDIGKEHMVQFIQPDSSAVALNKVTGQGVSQIAGSLKANGRVFLLNPNGVIAGKDAVVSTAGFLASAKNMHTAEFMQGNYRLEGGSAAGAQVINQGSLTTSAGGFIVLAADRVRNEGSISTPGGSTVLAAADSVTLKLDEAGIASVTVNGSVISSLAENRGLISATDGQVYLTARGKEQLLQNVVNNSGIIDAGSMSTSGGVIRLDGGAQGVVSHSGSLLADSGAGRGGRIVISGKNIHLAADSRTSATGRSGGGEVYAGGGWQGKDPQIVNAEKLVMDKGAVINVSAADDGSGGKAVLWSERYTGFYGSILARGGSQGGSGGQAETSSRGNLQAFGSVDSSASRGQGGAWLLDPISVSIVDGTTSGVVHSPTIGLDGKTEDIFQPVTPATAGAQINVQDIQNALNTGSDVTIVTSGDGGTGDEGNITVTSSIEKISGTKATFTLEADNNIVFNDNTHIAAIISALNVDLLAGKGKTITLGENFVAHLSNGDFYAGAKDKASDSHISLVTTGSGDIAADNITINGNFTGNSYSLVTGGNLTINGNTTLTAGNNSHSCYCATGTLTIDAGAGGKISITSTDTEYGAGSIGGGYVTLRGSRGVNLTAATLAMDSLANGIRLWESEITSDGGGITLNVAKVNLTHNNLYAVNDITFTNATGVTIVGSQLTGANITATGIKNGFEQYAWNQTSSQLTAAAGNITISNTNPTDGSQRIYGAKFGNGNTLSAANGNIDINISSPTNYRKETGDSQFYGISITDGNTFTAGNITLNGSVKGAINGAGLSISSGNADRTVIINATAGNVTLTGTGDGNYSNESWVDVGYGSESGIVINNVSISATDKLLATGISKVSLNNIYNTYAESYVDINPKYVIKGVSVNNAVLKAASAEITATATGAKVNADSRGFSLKNITWQGAVSDNNGESITLSSAGSTSTISGSGDKIENSLGVGALNKEQYRNILPKGIENDTSVFADDMFTGDNWVSDYSRTGAGVSKPGQWLVRNAVKELAGNIDVAGLTFIHSNITANGTLKVSNGTIRQDSDFYGKTEAIASNVTLMFSKFRSGAALTLNGTTTGNATVTAAGQLTAENGSEIKEVSVLNGSNITFNNSNITKSTATASGNISAENGSEIKEVSVLNGSNITLNNSNITKSTATASGNISAENGSQIKGNSVLSGKNITLNNSNITQSIASVRGNISAENGSQIKEDSLLTALNITLDNSGITKSAAAATNDISAENAVIAGGSALTASNNINALNANISASKLTTINGNISFTGDQFTRIVAGAVAGCVSLVGSSITAAKDLLVDIRNTTDVDENTLEISGSALTAQEKLNITVHSQKGGGESSAFYSSNSTFAAGEANAGTINICITAKGRVAQAVMLEGSTFNGDLQLDAKLESVTTGDRNAVVIRDSVTESSGAEVVKGLTLNGENNTIKGIAGSDGTGIRMDETITVNGNLTLNGTSSGAGGRGVILFAAEKTAVINGDLLAEGYTDSGKGIVLQGGALQPVVGETAVKRQFNGNASGAGTGAEIQPGTSALTGITVCGTAVTGTGITINRALNDSVLEGNATSNNGVGVRLTSASALTRTTITGESRYDTGVIISGADVLQGDPDSVITGNSHNEGMCSIFTYCSEYLMGYNKFGVDLQASVHGGNAEPQADGSLKKMRITGSGAYGVNLADNISITNVSIQGHDYGFFTDSSAVNVAGNATLNNSDITGISSSTNGGSAGVRTSGRKLESDATSKITGISTGSDGIGVILTGMTEGGNITGKSTATWGTQNRGIQLSTYSGQNYYWVNNAVLDGSSKTGDNGAGVYFGGAAVPDMTPRLMGNTSVTGTNETGAGVIIASTLSNDAGVEITGISQGSGNGAAGVLLNGNVTGGKITGNSTASEAAWAGDIVAGIRVSATATFTDATLAGNADSNYGVYLDGSKDITLVHTSLTGSSNTGVAVMADGNLSGNNTSSVTGTSNSSADKGAVYLRGNVNAGAGSVAPGERMTISGTTAGGGTGVRIEQSGFTFSPQQVNNVNVQGNSAAGGADDAGVLIVLNITNTRFGNSNISGTNSAAGSGVTIRQASTSTGGLANHYSLTTDNQSHITGDTTAGSGTGVLIAEGVYLTDGDIEGKASAGRGIQLQSEGKLENTTLNGTSVSNTGVHLMNSETLVTSEVQGTSSTGTGVLVEQPSRDGLSDVALATANKVLQGDAHSTITGTNTGSSGTGVELQSSVYGGLAETLPAVKKMTIRGYATTGDSVSNAVVPADSLTLTNVSINGDAAGSGSGVDIAGGATLAGTEINGSNSGAGNGVVTHTGTITGSDNSGISGRQTGGIPAAETPVAGVVLNGGTETESVTVSGSSVNAAGVRLNEGAQVTLGSITGETENGQGVIFNGGAKLKGTVVEGTSTKKGTGVVLQGSSGTGSTLWGNPDGYSEDLVTITGTAKGDGDGAIAENMTLSKIHLEGLAEKAGKGVKASDITISRTGIAGQSAGGTGVSLAGNNQLNEGNNRIIATTGNGTALETSGKLTGDGASTITAVVNTDNGNGALLSGEINSVKKITATGSGNGYGMKLSNAQVKDSELAGISDAGNAVEFTGSDTLKNTPVTATTQTGVAVVSDRGSSLKGLDDNSEASKITARAGVSGGKAATLAGGLENIYLDAWAVSGAVEMTDGSLINSILEAISDSGDTISFLNRTGLTDSRISAILKSGPGSAVTTAPGGEINGDHATTIQATALAAGGSGGTGATIGGTVKGTQITATSADKTGLLLAEDVRMEDGEHEGRTGASGSPAVKFAGDATLIRTIIRGISDAGGDTLATSPGGTIQATDSTFNGSPLPGSTAEGGSGGTPGTDPGTGGGSAGGIPGTDPGTGGGSAGGTPGTDPGTGGGSAGGTPGTDTGGGGGSAGGIPGTDPGTGGGSAGGTPGTDTGGGYLPDPDLIWQFAPGYLTGAGKTLLQIYGSSSGASDLFSVKGGDDYRSVTEQWLPDKDYLHKDKRLTITLCPLDNSNCRYLYLNSRKPAWRTIARSG